VEAHVIVLALHRAQAGFDIAQARAKSQLGESQTKELIEAGKAAEFVIAIIARHALVELVRLDVIDQLGEDGAAGKYALLSGREARPPWKCLNPSAEVHIEKLQAALILLTLQYLLVRSRVIAGQQWRQVKDVSPFVFNTGLAQVGTTVRSFRRGVNLRG
jgi:hypothetical protein